MIPNFLPAGSILSRKHGLATFVHERLEKLDKCYEDNTTLAFLYRHRHATHSNCLQRQQQSMTRFKLPTRFIFKQLFIYDEAICWFILLLKPTTFFSVETYLKIRCGTDLHPLHYILISGKTRGRPKNLVAEMSIGMDWTRTTLNFIRFGLEPHCNSLQKFRIRTRFGLIKWKTLLHFCY